MNTNKIQVVSSLDPNNNEVNAYPAYGLLVLPNSVANSFLNDNIISNSENYDIHFTLAAMWLYLHIPSALTEKDLFQAVRDYNIDHASLKTEFGCIDYLSQRGLHEDVTKCRRYRSRLSPSFPPSPSSININEIVKFTAKAVVAGVVGGIVGSIIVRQIPSANATINQINNNQ